MTLARAAIEDLDALISVLNLPGDTRVRVRTCLEPLADFPLLGPALAGRWVGLRFLLGQWRWMLLVYRYDEPKDSVVVVTVQDARSSSSPTSMS
ncbi:MAG: type II toxin-antitoxin system RelE/ParE family toxin [Euzebya sp.]